MAEKEDIKNLEKSNKSDFGKLNDTLKQNNDAEDKRDKRRLDQATAHSQKSEKNLQALKGVVTSTESESTTKELKSDKWELIEFPAILPSGKPVWPEYWKLDELEGVKASLSIGKWNAQWMQNPTAEEGSLIKRDWWKTWEKDHMPPLEHIIQSYDTAFSKKETADYSAITTWGIFTPHDGAPDAIILIDAIKGKYDFPELKMVALDQYKYWQPETVIIEAKASGQSLLQDLRMAGVRVIDMFGGCLTIYSKTNN